VTFAHDTEVALNSAAALVNTDPGAGSGEDTLQTPEQLVTWLDEVGWYGHRTGDRAELDAVRSIRPQLRAMWRMDLDQLVTAVNQLLTDYEALPQLVDHDDLGWHIHAVPQEAPLAARMLVEAAMAFTDVIRADELDRLKDCAADDCDNIVVDLSRNRSKRFCEGGCGNRENVRAYRDRQRA
jgi:predicted RNA-binding Zn ribbon-like protein